MQKMFSIKRIEILFFLVVLTVRINGDEEMFGISMIPSDVTVILGQTAPLFIRKSGRTEQEVIMTLFASEDGFVNIIPSEIKFPVSDFEENQMILIRGIKPGSLYIRGGSTPEGDLNFRLFVRVGVAISLSLLIISVSLGWIYFASWSISFYPQIYQNYSRKSVVGLSFDYLGINAVGHVMYGLFNVGLYWIPVIQEEYFQLYPNGHNPVQLNDVVFSIHGVLATFFTIGKGQQIPRCTWIDKVGFLGIIIFCLIIATKAFIFASLTAISWLGFLYLCSYIKIGVTLIKYIPQAYMNYKRKSTIGWSFFGVILDFIGGLFSIVQMILDAYNFDDWNSIFGDPTKFLLGFCTIFFDLIFIFQHCFLYRESRRRKSTEKLIHDF